MEVPFEGVRNATLRNAVLPPLDPDPAPPVRDMDVCVIDSFLATRRIIRKGAIICRCWEASVNDHLSLIECGIQVTYLDL